jgi:hypothetical protein
MPARTVLLAGVTALALSAAPAFALDIGINHNSIPVADSGSHAATNGGTNANESGNLSGNTLGSDNGNRLTADSNNANLTGLSASGVGSATALDGLAVVNDTRLQSTTTEIATSVVNGTVEHNGAGYGPGAVAFDRATRSASL